MMYTVFVSNDIYVYVCSRTNRKRMPSEHDDIFSNLIRQDSAVNVQDSLNITDVKAFLQLKGALKLVVIGSKFIVLASADCGYNVYVYQLNTAPHDDKTPAVAQINMVALRTNCKYRQSFENRDFAMITSLQKRIRHEPSAQLALFVQECDVPENATDSRVMTVSAQLFTALFGVEFSLAAVPVAVIGLTSGQVITYAISGHGSDFQPSLLFDMKQPIVGIYGLDLSRDAANATARRPTTVHDVIAVVGDLGKLLLMYIKNGELIMHEKLLDGPVFCADASRHVLLHSTLSDVFVSELSRDDDDGTIGVQTHAVGFHHALQVIIRPQAKTPGL